MAKNLRRALACFDNICLRAVVTWQNCHSGTSVKPQSTATMLANRFFSFRPASTFLNIFLAAHPLRSSDVVAKAGAATIGWNSKMAALQESRANQVESVELALSILDGYELRGKRVSVERAKFQMKGDYDPTKKPKKKPKDKKKLKELQEKLLDWRPDRQRGVRGRFEKTVIIKNMFDPKEFETDATLILEYQNDLREECSKFGTVKKVVVYDRHPEGVASVAFEEAEMADKCIATLHNRWFARRKLDASTWDGKAKYAVQETDEERDKRLKQWEDYLKREEQTKLEQKGSGDEETTREGTSS